MYNLKNFKHKHTSGPHSNAYIVVIDLKWFYSLVTFSSITVFKYHYITNNTKPFICSLSQLFFETPQYVYIHAHHTHLITEALHLVACVQLFKQNVKVKVTAIQQSLTLIMLVTMTFFNYKASPTTDNDYSYHIKAVALV